MPSRSLPLFLALLLLGCPGPGDAANAIPSGVDSEVFASSDGTTDAPATPDVASSETTTDVAGVPDVAVVLAKRHVHEAGCFPGAPDLAVEVVSPSDKFIDVQQKAFDYLALGCRVVWVVDPAARTVAVYSEGENRLLTAADVLTGGELLPGFEVPVAELFPAD